MQVHAWFQVFAQRRFLAVNTGVEDADLPGPLRRRPGMRGPGMVCVASYRKSIAAARAASSQRHSTPSGAGGRHRRPPPDGRGLRPHARPRSRQRDGWRASKCHRHTVVGSARRIRHIVDIEHTRGLSRRRTRTWTRRDIQARTEPLRGRLLAANLGHGLWGSEKVVDATRRRANSRTPIGGAALTGVASPPECDILIQQIRMLAQASNDPSLQTALRDRHGTHTRARRTERLRSS